MKPTSVETSQDREEAASLWAIKPRPLSAEDEQRLNDWLASDPRRRGAYLRAQAAWAALSKAKALGPSKDWAVPTAPIASSKPNQFTRRHIYAAGFGGIAATVLALFMVNGSKQSNITAKGEIRRMPMGDGSIASINTESKMTVKMTETARMVELEQGEVWFKVAKNKKRPFTVSAGLVRVQAVGTAFSVRRRDEGVEVLVTEGVVKAWLDGVDHDAVFLKAGDRTFITQNGQRKVDHAPQAIDTALAWREGQIELTGQTLYAVAEEFNRYNHKKFVVLNPSLGEERLIGRMSADDPEAFSRAVEQAFDAQISQTDEAIYIDVKKKKP